MDAKDRAIKQKTSGKVRVGHGGRRRGTPYSRPAVRQSGETNVTRTDDKSFVGKVASYIVPQWLTSWFSGRKEELNEDSESENEIDDDRNLANDDHGQLLELPNDTEAKAATSNHFDKNLVPRNMASTPLVNDMPFTMLNSTVASGQGGPSNTPQSINLEATEADSVKRSFSKLLSVDGDDENGNNHLQRSTYKSFIDGSDVDKKILPLNQSAFSLGTGAVGPPQKFFATHKKPSFKVSSFVSSSPLLPCGSSSSFYPGKTSYGGAASFQSRNVKRQKMSPVASDVPRKASRIRPKQLSSAQRGVTSDTARKILGALERMSSPVVDASKLPSSPSSVLFKPTRSKSDQSFNLFAPKAINPRQPPTSSVSLSHNVNIQLREKRNEPFRFESGIIKPSAPVKTFKSQRLPTAFSPDDDYKGGGKIRRQRQQCHYSAVDKSVEEPVNTLPEIQSTPTLVMSSLPKFDFGASTATKSKAVELKSSSAVESKAVIFPNEKTSEGFTFSQPEVISHKSERSKGAVPKNSFQFSVPTKKENQNEIGSKIEKIATKDAPKIDLTTEEPKDAGIQEKPIVSVPVISEKKSSIWGSKSNNWVCDTCMLSNDEKATACIACQSLKPGSKNAKSSDQEKKLTFAAKFKAAEGSWECNQCMLKNSAESSECKACNAKKTGDNLAVDAQKSAVSNKEVGKLGSIFDKFKKGGETWECSSCMLSNKTDINECAACGNKRSGDVAFKASKPGTQSEPKSISFGINEQKGGVKFGTDSVKFGIGDVKFGTGDVKFGTGDVKFGTGDFNVGAGDVNFGTGGFKIGTSSLSSSVTFGTNTGTNLSTGTLSNTSGTVTCSFGSNDNKAPVINFGTSNSGNSLFGTKQAGSSGAFGIGSRFSFGASEDKMRNDPEPVTSSSKTEENNNLSNAKVDVASPVKVPADNPCTVSPVKDPQKDTPGKEGIRSIADAAQAGLLKVPELEKKNNSDTHEQNGTTAALTFSAPERFKFGSDSSDNKMAAEPWVSSSSLNPFKFGADSLEKDQKLLSVFSFAKSLPTSQGQTPTNVGFGANNMFSSTSGGSTAEESSVQLTNQSKGPSSFEKSNLFKATEIPGKFSFGSNKTFSFNAEGESDVPSANQAKLVTAEASIFTTVTTSESSARSNIFAGTSQSASGSLFQNPDKPAKSKSDSGNPFLFQANPIKPLSGLFAQSTDSNSLAAEEKKSVIQENNIQNNLFDSTDSNTASNKSLFGNSPFAKIASPPSDTIGALSGMSTDAKFTFSSNSNNLTSVFGSQQPQRTESGPTSGFNFSAIPLQNPGIQNSVSLFKTVNSTDENPKPFSFTTPSDNTKPFNFATPSDNSKAFSFMTPSENQGPHAFSFGNSQVTTSVPSAGSSASYSFGTGGDSSVGFSSGKSSLSQKSTRVMKRAVRRKNKLNE